jgi:hypothetical protein
MLKSGEKLQKLLILLITWALLLVCFVAYQQYFVKRQESFFRERGFRALNRLASQLGLKFEQAQVSTESFVKLVARKDEINLGDYLDVYLKDVLKDVQSNDKSIEAAKKCRPKNTKHIPLLSKQDRDGLTLSIYCFTERGQENQDSPDSSKTPLIYTLNLESRIRNGFQEQGSDFEDVLVADSNGRVVFQESTVGPRIADLKSVLTDTKEAELTQKPAQSSAESSQNNDAKRGKTKQPGQKASVPDRELTSPEVRELNKLNDTSTFTDVTLAGEPYKVFSRPVQISLHSEFPGRPPLKLVVVGLRHSSKFISDTHALPYSTLIWAGLIALALFSLSWPLFKLHYMSATERFTPKDGWFLVITIFLAATSVTLILLNASYIAQAKSETDKHLKALSRKIQDNFSHEMELVRQQLQQFREDAVKHAPKDAAKSNLIPNYLKNASATPLSLVYPYFEIAFWSDCDGMQRLKFDVRQAPTPSININNLAFFKSLRSEMEWVSKPKSKNAKERWCNSITKAIPADSKLAYFQALKSPNTDEFSALLATPFPPGSKPEKHPDFAVQALTTRPMSLMNPVLPPGYGFAVFDAACNVLFHSDLFRDGNENFCEESESRTELGPWLFSGIDSSLDISYAGHSERAYLTAFHLPGASSGQAFLIVFQEPDRQVTLNLAMILVCSLLLGAYAAIFLLTAGIHLALRRPLHLIYSPQFMWPCRRHALAYIQLAAANSGMLLLFWLVYPRLYEAPLLALTLAVPFLSLVFTIAKLNKRLKVLTILSLVLVGGGDMGLLLSCFWNSQSLQDWCWVFVFFATCGTIAHLLSGDSARTQRFTTRFFRHPKRIEDSAQRYFTVLYVLAALSVITSAALVPSLGFFKYAYDAVSELTLKHDQVVVSDRLLARFNRIHGYYETVDSLPKDRVAEKRIQQTWDRHDTFDQIFFEMCEPRRPEQTCSYRMPVAASEIGFNERIEKLIAGATLLFPSNRLGSEMSKLGVAGNDISNGTQPWERAWSEDEHNPRAFALTWNASSRMPGFKVESIYLPWEGLRWWAKGCLVLLWVILAVWLITVVKKIFFTEFEGALTHDEVDWKGIADIKKSSLIIGPAKTGKTSWLRDIVYPPVVASHAVAAAAPLSGVATMPVPAASVAAAPLAGEWRDLRSHKQDTECPNQPSVLVLDHFEFNLRDPKCNRERLKLLEDRLYDSECKVVVVSTVDPLFYLTEGAPEMLAVKNDPAGAGRLLDRWARVLSKLTRVRLKDSGETEFPDTTVAGFKNEHEHCEEHQCCRQLGEWISKECRHTAMLRSIGKEILDQFREDDLVTHEWVVRNVLERADLYYHVLWSGMTGSERLVLYQLALDGWANPKNVAALQQLERKSLIFRDPMYRIMNESFRRFIESAEHADEIAQWAKNERQSTWHAFRLVAIAVAIGTAVWVVYTQAALSQAVAGYVAGIATLLTAVTSLFGRSGKTDQSKSETSKSA